MGGTLRCPRRLFSISGLFQHLPLASSKPSRALKVLLFAEMSALVQVLAHHWIASLLALAGIAHLVGVYRKYRRLEAFRGPFSTGWSELWHAHKILGLNSHLAYKHVTDKYGIIARVGPNDLITASPELLTHMNAVRSPYTRTWWYYAASRQQPGKDHVFSQVNEEKHTKRRQQMAAGVSFPPGPAPGALMLTRGGQYSGKENLTLEGDIDGQVIKLLDLLRRKFLTTSARSVPVDLARKIQYFTLDVISTIGFGEAFGDLDADADVGAYVESSEQGMRLITVVAALGLTRVFHWPPVARLLGPSEQDQAGFGRMMGVARAMIDHRYHRSMEGRSDMLASFARHGLGRDDLCTEAFLQILAGSDTTATAIRATMLHLISNPRVYRRLQAEVDEAVARGDVSPDGIVQDKTLRSLPYLQAVFREGLRIHPPISDIAPKKVPAGGDTVVVDGRAVFLPGGTNVGYSVFGLHHSKALFGADAEHFRPERWIPDENGSVDPDRLDEMRRTTELIFGYGKYQCLGKAIASLEITKVLFEFMRHFDWALVNPECPWRSKNYLGIFLQDEMYLEVTARA